MATDKRILYTEYMVGATHPSLADTLNRLMLMDHQNSGAHRYIAYELTNSAAGSTAVGDVLAVSSQTAILGDTVSSLQKYVVAVEVIANAATGRFASGGIVSAKSNGAIAAMQYVRKSATTRAIEDAGVAVGATTSPPSGAVGIALAAASGGLCTILLFDVTVSVVAVTRSTADVTTEEATTSTTYADLATVGPAVTLTPGRTTDQMILVSTELYGTPQIYASVAIAGAAAADVNAAEGQTANRMVLTRPTLTTGVASGGTHTMKYRVSSGTGTFINRRIAAFTLS